MPYLNAANKVTRPLLERLFSYSAATVFSSPATPRPRSYSGYNQRFQGKAIFAES
jgi:hypothetical protein